MKHFNKTFFNLFQLVILGALAAMLAGCGSSSTSEPNGVGANAATNTVAPGAPAAGNAL